VRPDSAQSVERLTAIALPVLDAPAPPARPQRLGDASRMVDSHGRTIRDVRISVTDRCNFRCVYCLEPDARFMDRTEAMTAADIARLGRVLVGMGVEKLRITGGEPTVHPDLLAIIEGLARAGARDLAMTTNGSLVTPDRAKAWRDAGLGRVTISIDSLRADRFRAITRSACPPEQVLDAIAICNEAGLGPVKVNIVIVNGWNDDEVADLAGLARRFGVDVRFIEFMPLDDARSWDRSRLLPAAEAIARIRAAHDLVPLDEADPSSTSFNFAFADGAPGRIGMIAPVTRPFCGACARLRITADGKVRPCLFSRDEWDLRPTLRSGTDADLARFLADATWTKQAGHGIGAADFEQPERPMSAIGG
jgi:cyclic pyranopterin phosphate synthase